MRRRALIAGEKLVEGEVVGHRTFADDLVYRKMRGWAGGYLLCRSKQRKDRVRLIKFGMANDPNVERLLLQIITVLVDKSNEVNVTSVTADIGTIFHVTVAPSDVGKVIGKGGRMAGALRILLSAIGVAVKRQYGLNIVTTDDPPLRLP
jgi:predicted RNA-binding protein YlqC (UPF0109 family)